MYRRLSDTLSQIVIYKNLLTCQLNAKISILTALLSTTIDTICCHLPSINTFIYLYHYHRNNVQLILLQIQSLDMLSVYQRFVFYNSAVFSRIICGGRAMLCAARPKPNTFARNKQLSSNMFLSFHRLYNKYLKFSN